jgi:hypothetical protein
MEVIQMDIIIMVVGNYLGILLEKKLFDDGGVNINYNNNINIVNFIDNKRKNMKTQKFETKEDKDKSITVNT